MFAPPPAARAPAAQAEGAGPAAGGAVDQEEVCISLATATLMHAEITQCTLSTCIVSALLGRDEGMRQLFGVNHAFKADSSSHS